MLTTHVRLCARAAVIAVALAMASPSLAQAPVTPAQAAGSVEKHGDWELVCTPAAAPTQAAATSGQCRLVQNHVGETGKTGLLVTILSGAVTAAAKGPVAIVSVPKSVYLAPGIEMKVDGGATFKLLYETCNDGGCHAGYKITGDIAEALKKGQIASHKVFDSQQKPVNVDVSLKGLRKALDRLADVSQ